MDDVYTVLDEEVIFSEGSFRRVRRWLEGWVNIPGGVFIRGTTGDETVVTVDVIASVKTFEVVETAQEAVETVPMEAVQAVS